MVIVDVIVSWRTPDATSLTTGPVIAVSFRSWNDDPVNVVLGHSRSIPGPRALLVFDQPTILKALPGRVAGCSISWMQNASPDAQQTIEFEQLCNDAVDAPRSR